MTIKNNDIVTRLRNYDFMRDGDTPDLTMAEAADEIERLREMCEQFAKSAKLFGTQWGSDVEDFRVNEKKFLKAWKKYKGGAW